MIDYVAGALELTGSYTIGNKLKYGFLCKALSNALWIFIGLKAELYGLLAVAVVAMVLNVRNYFKWRKGSLGRWQRKALGRLLNL